MEKISDIFGSMVFNDAVMRERLPKETYRQVQATMEKGKRMLRQAIREAEQGQLRSELESHNQEIITVIAQRIWLLDASS